MFLGVDHVGVGVSDMDAAVEFYAQLSFTDVAFDYSGPLPGLERLTHHPVTQARVVLLRTDNPTSVGLAALKLVQITDRPVPPMPEGIAWGERGICEICIHVRDHADVYERITTEHGAGRLMEPCQVPDQPPHANGAMLGYVTDPEGGKIELIEWDHLRDWPQRPGPQGINHVAFGTLDIERSRTFYGRLGFDQMLFDSDGVFEPMDSWYAPRSPPRQHMIMLANPHGGGIEPVQHDPPSPDMRGEWGHVGPMEFAVGVTNLERACEELAAEGIRMLCEPQTIELAAGTWRYAYLGDPDELYVCLSETRY